MTKDELKNLKEGDVIASMFDGKVYMVTGNYGDRATAVRTVDVTNPAEWELRLKAIHERPHK